MRNKFGLSSLVLIASAIINQFGCANQKESSVQALIDKDERSPVTDSEILATVGTFHAGGGAICTAFAIGDREVLTAAHCLNKITPVNEYQFRTATFGFRPLSRVLYVNPEADIAILQTRDLNKKYLKSASEESKMEKPQLYGFDLKSLQIVRTQTGSIKNIGSGIIAHTFDTLPGHSGGPIIDKGRVVAIHVGHSPKEKSNIAVSFSAIKTAKIAERISDFHKESFAVSTLKAAIDACSKSAACVAIANELAQRVTAVLIDFVIEFIDRKLQEVLDTYTDSKKSDMDYRSPFDRDNPHNGSPGGWAGSDSSDAGWKDLGSMALTGSDGESAKNIGLSIAAAINLIYQQSLGRDANADEFRENRDHINNGASYGFLKAKVLQISSFFKSGNNGTTSCNNYCGRRDWAGGVGSCVRASSGPTGSISCAASPGFLNGAQLNCECLQDSFSKPGNNGTVSCHEYCFGGIWGEVGNCLAAYDASSGANLSCEAVTGRPQDCTCGGFKQH